MLLTITTEDDNLYSVEVDETATVAALKQVVEFHSGIPSRQQTLWHHNRSLEESATLKASGVGEHDLVMLRRASQPQQQPGTGSSVGLPPGADLNALVQQLASNPALMAQLPPDIRAGIQRRDPSSIHQLVGLLQAQEVAKRQEEIDALNFNEFDPDAQARIAERIRQENISANMEAAFEHSPEVFGEIVMLHVNLEVNGTPLKAFVDSGAQSCVMSLACAERCNIAHLIDKRFQGIVQGVGTQKMAGRVHSVRVSVGKEHVPMAVTIIESLDIDFLFGLDMLRRYKCCIDLEHNCLRFGALEDISLPFLPEHEIPNRKPRQLLSPEDGTVGSPGLSPTTAAGAAASARAAASSVGPSAAGNPSPAARTVPVAGTISQDQATQPGAHASGGQGVEFETKLAQLQNLGFPKQQCVEALSACGGNVDHAAALLFGS